MTKLFRDVVAEVEALSDEEQDAIAFDLLTAGDRTAPASCNLSEEQAAELRRRLADPDPRFLSLEEFREQMRRLTA